MGPQYWHTGPCFCGEGREDSPGCRSSTLFDQLCLAHHSVVTVSWQSPVLTLTFWSQSLRPHYIATGISGDRILSRTLPRQDPGVGPGAAHVAARAHLGTRRVRDCCVRGSSASASRSIRCSEAALTLPSLKPAPRGRLKGCSRTGLCDVRAKETSYVITLALVLEQRGICCSYCFDQQVAI